MRSETTPTLGLLALASLALMSCNADLEGFVYNPVHCSTVPAEGLEIDIEDEQISRDAIPCEQDYDFQFDYPWPDGVFSGDDARPIPDSLVARRVVPTRDGEGELDTYFITAHGDDAELAQVTLVYNHGNYASIEHYLPRVRMLHEMGFNILVWDYRGYGKSEPVQTPNSDQFIDDSRVIRDLADELAPDLDKIVSYGISMGAIPAIEMALHDQPCALLLEAPFTSMQRIARRNAGASIPDGFLTKGNFDNLSKIEDYDGPLYVMIGDEDELFTIEDATDFKDGTQGYGELWVVPGARHGIGRGVPERAPFDTYAQNILTFLGTHALSCGISKPQ